MTGSFLTSLLWRLLIPIIVIGTVCSIALSSYLVPPIISTLEERIDKTVKHTANLAVNICEERLNDMLDIRMEGNAEMNTASKKEAIEEIKKIARIFDGIKMMVLDDEGTIQGASFSLPDYSPRRLLQSLEGAIIKKSDLKGMELWGDPVLLEDVYFPFWRWHIVSFISEKDYLAPIIMSKRLVQFGTFGTLLAVIVSVVFLFTVRINRPLKKIILATDEVIRGNFKQIGMKGSGEIEQVAVAFDHMVSKLDADKNRINLILQELSDSEEQYRVLSESSLALVLMLQNDTFLYVNRQAAAFFQHTPSELVGKNIYSVFMEGKDHIFRQKVEALESGQSNVEHFEAPFELPEEKEVWLEILGSVIPFQSGTSILIHAINISKRKVLYRQQSEMREKISRAERMETLATLAGGVAHDLNNMLSGMVGYPELLLHGLSEDDKMYAPLQTIHKSGKKAAAIVQDLLTLTRRGVVVTEVENLGEIIKEYLTSPEFENLMGFYPDIEVTKDIAPDLMNMKGSYHHLSKSIMNLVTNAMEAMPKGGVITLKAENRYVDMPVGSYEDIVEGEYVVMTITDRGQGISEDDIGKIFEPFYTKKVMGRSGTGLGMSVVWGTVKDHNGYIEVVSKEEVGTTFTLYFPASRKRLEAQETSFNVAEIMGDGQKILVVDDAEEQRIIATSILKELGYNASAVASGEEAVSAVKKSSFDLLVLDMIMDPGMDGLDTYREILKVQPRQKAIIASGYSETDRVRKTMSLGAGVYVKKPYGLEQLAGAIARELNRV